MSGFSLPKETERAPAPAVDKDALRQFAAGAKDHRTDREPPPWEQYDADAVPKNNVSVRLNDHQLEKLRYLAKARGISQQKIMNEILLPAIEEQAEAAYRRR
jgi:predicted DNA binding CopG/RHH family protein